jgi:hypothetical protein
MPTITILPDDDEKSDPSKIAGSSVRTDNLRSLHVNTNSLSIAGQSSAGTDGSGVSTASTTRTRVKKPLTKVGVSLPSFFVPLGATNNWTEINAEFSMKGCVRGLGSEEVTEDFLGVRGFFYQVFWALVKSMLSITYYERNGSELKRFIDIASIIMLLYPPMLIIFGVKAATACIQQIFLELFNWLEEKGDADESGELSCCTRISRGALHTVRFVASLPLYFIQGMAQAFFPFDLFVGCRKLFFYKEKIKPQYRWVFWLSLFSHVLNTVGVLGLIALIHDDQQVEGLHQLIHLPKNIERLPAYQLSHWMTDAVITMARPLLNLSSHEELLHVFFFLSGVLNLLLKTIHPITLAKLIHSIDNNKIIFTGGLFMNDPGMAIFTAFGFVRSKIGTELYARRGLHWQGQVSCKPAKGDAEVASEPPTPRAAHSPRNQEPRRASVVLARRV